MKAYTQAAALKRLREAVAAAGGQMAYATEHKINRSYLNNVLSRQRAMTDVVAKTIGLKRVMMFVDRETG